VVAHCLIVHAVSSGGPENDEEQDHPVRHMNQVESYEKKDGFL
jgi:hypothetical protein